MKSSRKNASAFFEEVVMFLPLADDKALEKEQPVTCNYRFSWCRGWLWFLGILRLADKVTKRLKSKLNSTFIHKSN